MSGKDFPDYMDAMDLDPNFDGQWKSAYEDGMASARAAGIIIIAALIGLALIVGGIVWALS
jgi:hypothetical protein